jgi:hypothetical protein
VKEAWRLLKEKPALALPYACLGLFAAATKGMAGARTGAFRCQWQISGKQVFPSNLKPVAEQRLSRTHY